MIIRLKNNIQETQAAQLADQHQAFLIHEDGFFNLITGSGVKELPQNLESHTEQFSTTICNWLPRNTEPQHVK
jgi:hypothetical protein